MLSVSDTDTYRNHAHVGKLRIDSSITNGQDIMVSIYNVSAEGYQYQYVTSPIGGGGGYYLCPYEVFQAR